jgi:hypothetical protein
MTILQAIENTTPHQNFGPGGEAMNLIDSSDITPAFDDAVADMRETLERFEEFEGLSQEKSTVDIDRVADSIRLQLATNLLGAAIFAVILPKGLSAERYTATNVSAALRQLEKELKTSSIKLLPAMTRLYIAAGAFLVNPSQSAGEQLRKMIADFRDGQYERSPADIAELDYLERHVNAALVPRVVPAT